MEVIHGRGYVYALQYHIVWCVKYRRKVLTPEVENSLSDILHVIASNNGFVIEELNTDLDHVHMLIQTSPQVFIPNIIKAIKGTSSRYLFKHHPEIKKKLWDGHLWNPSYYIATVSDQTEDQIRDYIRSQKER